MSVDSNGMCRRGPRFGVCFRANQWKHWDAKPRVYGWILAYDSRVAALDARLGRCDSTYRRARRRGQPCVISQVALFLIGHN